MAYVLFLLCAFLKTSLAHAAAPPPPLKGGGSCVGPVDCQLNGNCASGRCACLAAWTGSDCSQLHLLPAPTQAAFPPHGPAHTAVSTWGAGVVPSADGKLYHMFVSEMQRSCGLKSWTRNSAIRHAVSELGPEGPYIPRDLVQPNPFAHNPKPVELADGTKLIYHIGCGGPLHPGPEYAPLNCTNGTTPIAPPGTSSTTSTPSTPGNHNTGMGHSGLDGAVGLGPCNGFNGNVLSSNSGSWSGPWTSRGALYPNAPSSSSSPSSSPSLSSSSSSTGPSSSPVRFPFTMDNPAPLITRSGEAFVLFRSWCSDPSCSYAAHNLSLIGLARAEAWNGTYETPHDAIFEAQTEDPHLFQNEFGFHALFHDLCVPAKTCGGGTHPRGADGVGGHAFSEDGIAWTYSAAPAYTLQVQQRDGSTLHAGRRERPFLLLDRSGQPTHFFTGMQLTEQPRGGRQDHTFTHVQPVVTKEAAAPSDRPSTAVTPLE